MRILNIRNLEPATLDDIVGYCDARLNNGEGAFLVPMNPIKVVKARVYPEFQRLIDGADRVFPDAWGIKWAARVLHGQKIDVTPGWTVMMALLRCAAECSRSVYFLGTTSQILEEAIGILQAEMPELRVVGHHHGFYKPEEEDAVFAEITGCDPDYIFVAIGEKKQEEIIERLRRVHPRAICMGVGGSLDLVAGHQPMPPAWMRRQHLEWLFRAVRQPFRLPRFKALPVFVCLVLAERLGFVT